MACSLRTVHRRLVAVAAAGALASCAHGGAAGGAAATPAPALPPRVAAVRHVGSFPGTVAPERPSFWTRVASAVIGSEVTAGEAHPLLERPFGIAPVAGGFVVTDPDRRAVLRVAWREGRATAVECPALAWTAPIAVAAAPDGTLFVADGGRVVRVAAGGACAEIGAGALERPTGLALAGGLLYVVDAPRHQVVAFDARGTEALRFGGPGDEAADLSFPTAIAARPDGSLLVVDALHFRVARFSPEGRFLDAFGEAGDTVGEFGRPKAIAVDGAGGAWVTDAQHDAVLAFGPDGAFRFAAGESGGAADQLLMPAGVAADGALLYVADAYNHRVQIFELQGEGP
jgi:sugar lactone lactonase YvrE